jgi:hypothetical protein
MKERTGFEIAEINHLKQSNYMISHNIEIYSIHQHDQPYHHMFLQRLTLKLRDCHRDSLGIAVTDADAHLFNTSLLGSFGCSAVELGKC